MILKSCLDDMVDKYTGIPFAEDSDDDDDESSKKKKTIKKRDSGDEYAGSVRLKEGRNVQNNLYYVDHTKQANNGDGLTPDARNELLGKMAQDKMELDTLNQQLKQLTAEATTLESQPKNEELVLEVAGLEQQMKEMNDSLEEARSHASSEFMILGLFNVSHQAFQFSNHFGILCYFLVDLKHVKDVKKNIDKMTSIWRKRKRSCTEFIMLMEESTEGTISMKKCTKGDGKYHM